MQGYAVAVRVNPKEFLYLQHHSAHMTDLMYPGFVLLFLTHSDFA